MKLDINEDGTVVRVDYDYETYRELKKVPDSEFDSDNDSWTLNSKYARELLKQLQELNHDVLESINAVNDSNIQQKKYNTEDEEIIIKTVKIKILKENPKSLQIGFDFDNKTREFVKMTAGRSYKPKDYSWIIKKTEIDWLYEKLSSLEYVEVSELDNYTSDSHNSEVKISLQDFPHITITPYDFQMDTVNKLVNNKKMVNALEAGLGKTPITTMACEYLNKKTLVICPATIKDNWKKEIHKINPHADVTVSDSKDEWETGQYVILNYDIIDNFISDIVNEGFEIIVFDEAHKIRGIDGRGKPKSKRARLCVRLAEEMEYVFPITATPFINYTRDIFNLLKVIDHPDTSNWYSFANTYCAPDRSSGFGVNYDGSSNQEQLNERLYPNYMMRIRTEDHIELPERTRSFIPVDINMSKYNKAVKDYMDNRKSFETNGQHLVHLSIMRMELAVAKAKKSVTMIKDLLEQNESVAIFTNYTDVVDLIEEKFKDDAVKITGDVETKDRQKAVDLFQEGEKRVFIGNIDAAGEGITLTRSHHMIVIDFHWSPVVMVNQLEKRLHRITQTKPVSIQYLYVEGAQIDTMMLGMLEDKLNDSSMIIDGKKEDFFTDQLISSL
ncbi:DEAD/DEAH box helicase [Aquibacillus saliphilus]|uniref:DEAD/DEAH box helicase n=1 Tax=Aquibacillus saliphilus TaxID=1909422 RepID=UPI001CEFC311|nr:DEAD/DEAH box helicase [Aquibacillus saliphilus]